MTSATPCRSSSATGLELLIVDDTSPDGTGELAEAPASGASPSIEDDAADLAEGIRVTLALRRHRPPGRSTGLRVAL